MLNLVITIIVLLVATIVVLRYSKYLSEKASKIKDADTATIKSEIYHCDQATKKALSKLNSMMSLNDKIEVEQVISEQEVAIEAENSRLIKIQEKLSTLQAEVARQEEKIAQLKKGKEESFRLADDVRSKSEALEAERNRLEAELNNSKDQMIALKSELELTSAQASAIDEIYKAIDEASSRLMELSDSHQIASERFLNLQIQYEELEKEYSKLIAKELDPD